MPAPRTTKHYTAVVEVQQVTVTEHEGSGRGDDKTFRDKLEVARVVIRADTLAALQVKLTNHVKLIEE